MDPTSVGIDPAELSTRAEQLPDPIRMRGQRIVFHFQTSPQAVVDLLQLIATLKQEAIARGFDPAAATKKPAAAQNMYAAPKPAAAAQH